MKTNITNNTKISLQALSFRLKTEINVIVWAQKSFKRTGRICFKKIDKSRNFTHLIFNLKISSKDYS